MTAPAPRSGNGGRSEGNPVPQPLSRPVWFDRSGESAYIEVAGSDRAAFLGRILSGATPGPSRAAPTALLTPKGAVVAAGTAIATADAVFLECEAGRAEPLAAALDRYRIADDVRIRIEPPDGFFALAVEGEGGDEAVAAALGVSGTAVRALHPGDALEVASGFGYRVFRPWPSWRLRLTADSGADARSRIPATGIPEGYPELSEYVRAAAGSPKFGAEISESSLPLQAGLADSVRLGQGCYIGQEYVARQAHRGTLRERLFRVELARSGSDGARGPVAGDEVRSGGVGIGRLTTVAPPPKGTRDSAPPVLGLALLAADAAPDARVEVSGVAGVVREIPVPSDSGTPSRSATRRR